MIKICIVEDLPDIRNVLTERVNAEPGMACAGSYGDAESALGGLLYERPDAVIMDIGLPKMSGIECMVKVKSRYPDMRFLMFTVFENDDKVFDALKAGADGYILKREPSAKIIAALREILDGGAPMSRSIAQKVMHSFRTPPVEQPHHETLTARQAELLDLLAAGLPYKLIADRLSITEGTVKQHIHQIYQKLQVNNRVEAVNRYLGR
jgi:DNA-binding NarL/FixJ family response regulator